MFQGSPLLLLIRARDVCKHGWAELRGTENSWWRYYTMPSISKDNVDDETDQVLQAVILADSFNKRFKPLTIDRPKV
jgi:hypothetical protein